MTMSQPVSCRRTVCIPLLAAAICWLAGPPTHVDAAVLEADLAAPAAFVQPLAVSTGTFTDIPGTPSSFMNSGDETVIIGYTAVSAQPALISDSNIFGITSSVAGDIVMLIDPAGSNDPSNFSAVFRFLNPSDPTGTKGLAADEVEGFDTSNVGPGGFASFSLLPNVLFLADAPTGPGRHDAVASEFGPDGGILAGQLGTIIYDIDVTGVPEPGTLALAGIAVLGPLLRRRPSRGSRNDKR
jgi:hypothetical protein